MTGPGKSWEDTFSRSVPAFLSRFGDAFVWVKDYSIGFVVIYG